MKRHSGFGDGGPGQIYKIQVGSPTSASITSTTITQFVNLTALGINVGADPRTTTAPVSATPSANYLYPDKTLPNYDVDAFDKVGKMSIGDMDISDDDKTLWLVNLFDQKLYELPLGPNGTAPTAYTAHTLTAPTCASGVFRPWAVKYYRGKVYVGGVCTGEGTAPSATITSPANATTLQAYVYAHDPDGPQSNFTPVLNFPLNYPRGYATKSGTAAGDIGYAAWRPWIDAWSDIDPGFINIAYEQTVYPQPILSDIEFDTNGEMIIGLMDRFGHQSGNANYAPVAGTTAVYEGVSAGDILRAGRNADGTYTIENNATIIHTAATGVTSVTYNSGGKGQNPGQGPGNGEFYWQDMYGSTTDINGGPTGHQENTLGGLALWAGAGQVAATAFDPYSAFRAAGARYFDNLAGDADQVYQVLGQDAGDPNNRPASFGKSAGLGDLELLCNPAPIMIGNRVWHDQDNDGVQDPGEPTLAGVVVKLKGPGLVSGGVSVTTNSSGEYYFTNATGTAATGFAYGLNLTSGGSYSICFPTSASALVLSTKANSVTTANGDAIDTDADAAGIIRFVLGDAGENNFTYDAAFATVPPCSMTLAVTPGTCQSATNTYAVSGTLTITNGVDQTLVITDDSQATNAASITVTATAGTTAVPFSLTGIKSGTGFHTITVTSSATLCGTTSSTYTAPGGCLLACPGNLLVNASFEQGLPSIPTATTSVAPPPGWTGGLAEINPTVNFNVPDGNAFAYTSGTSTSMCQSVSANVGSIYTLTFFAGVHQANGQTVTLQFLNGSSLVGAPKAFTITDLLSSGSFGGPYTLVSDVAPAGTNLIRVCAVGTGTGANTDANQWAKVDAMCLTETKTCQIALTVTPGNCNVVTNQYTLSGTVSLSNSPATSLTITDGTRSAVVSITAGQSTAAFSLTGLNSGSGNHTVTVISSGTTCGTVSRTYAAPASCTVAASVAVTSATICYGTSATLTATGCASGTLTWSNSTTGTSLVTPNLTQTTNYTVTCATVSQTTFAVGTVTVMPQPVLSLQASSTNVTVGTPVSLSAIGCVGTVTWSTNATGATISVTPSQSTQTYSATCVTGPGCSTTASITVNTQPAASLVVVSATVCYGSSATLTASGCTGTVTWSNNTTGTSLVTPNLTATTNYTATCTTQTNSTTFAVGTVTVLPQPVLSLQASSTNVTVGTPVSLSAIGCVGTVTWSTGGSGSTISVTPSQSTQTYSATCVTGPGCSTTASITVNTQPAASLVVVSATVCYGSSATLTASGCTGTVTWSNSTTGTSLVTPNLTATTNYTATCTTQTNSTTFAVGTVTVMPQPVLSLQASSTNVTVGTPVSLSAIGCVGTVTWNTNATGATISVTPSQSTQTYSATCVTGPGCSTTASITVNTQPAASLVVVSATVCYGSSATLTASGCTGTVTWSNSTTGTSLVTPNLTATTNYTATCTTQTNSTTFAVGTVTVMPQPVLSLQVSSTNVTVGTPVSLSAIGCVGTVTWSTNATGATISVTSSQSTQIYSATCVTGPGCSTTASITVNTQPAASLVVVSATVCYGSSATLTASGCTGTVTWSNSTTGTSLVTPNLTATTNYTATCTTQTNSTTFAVGTVTVMPQPVLSLQVSSTNVTVGTPVSLSAIGCVGTVTWNTNATGATISVTPSQSTQTYSATCVTGPGCSTTASITVNTQPAASLVVVSATVCYGSSATLTASGCTGSVSWNTGSTGNSLVTPNLTATTNYTATCTTQTNSTTFAVGTVTVMPQPVLSLQASSTNVTVGTPVSLSAIGCVGTVTWSTNATGATISVTPSQSTQTYSATCVTGPGCSTTASITVNTQPAASLVVVSATVCYGSSATLTASGCTGSVSWNTGSTGNSLVTPNLTATTNYTATCTTQTGSATSAVGMVTVLSPVSLTVSRTSIASSTVVTISARGCANGTLSWSTGAADDGKTSIIVPATVSSIYTVTCTSGPGCKATGRIMVGSVGANEFTVNDAVICSGQSATLVSSGCLGTINWIGSGINGETTAGVIVNPAQTTSYTAICTNGTSVIEVVAQVTVASAPVLAATASPSAITPGQSSTLTVAGCQNGTLTWSAGSSFDGQTSIVVSPTMTTGYSVTCAAGPQCVGVATVTVTVGQSLTPSLSLDKLVSKSKAQLGELLTYTIVVSNTGTGPANNVIVRDSVSSGLNILPASVTTSVANSFTLGNPVSIWNITTLPANSTATIIFSASTTAEGVVYNKAMIPGDTASVCTSVPIKVCKGTTYAIELSAPAGYARYQWFRRSGTAQEVIVYDGSLSSYTATAAGEYRVVVNDVQGKCPDLSCCPAIIEEDSIPAFTVMAKSPTCIASQPQANGTLTVMGPGNNLSGYSYAISEGSSFTVTNPAMLALPQDGVVAGGLNAAKTYTVRIYNQLGCYRDVTVTMTVNCACPPEICVPVSIKKTKTRL